MIRIRFPFILVFIMLLSACKGKSDKEVKNNEAGTNEMQCYAYIENRDTIQLQLSEFPQRITGRLIYNIFEKDSNRGTIEGVMKGDTLFANYTFMSEGVESIREVAFVRIGENFIEAFGDAELQDNKVIFSDRQGLKLSDQIILKPTTCDDF